MTALPRNERVASRYAAGVPTSRMIAIEAAVVRRLSQSASSAPGSPRLSISSPGLESTKIATTGSVRKVSVAARTGPAAPGTSAGPVTARGRSPPRSSASAQSPSVSPSTNFCARSGCFGLRHHARAVGHLRLEVLRQVDRLQLAVVAFTSVT